MLPTYWLLVFRLCSECSVVRLREELNHAMFWRQLLLGDRLHSGEGPSVLVELSIADIDARVVIFHGPNVHENW